MDAYGQDARGAAPTVPGLVPWQVLFLALTFGLFAPRQPLAAACALALLVAFSDFPRRMVFRAFPLLIGFGVGWFLASAAMPHIPTDIPTWMLERETVRVTGRVAGTESCPGRMLRVLVDDASVVRAGGEVVPVPGRFLWNWQYPAQRPAPGAVVSVTTRVRPARGYLNPGGWDTAFHWARQGVFWRGWSSGSKGNPEVTARDDGLRARLARAVAFGGDGGSDVGQGRAVLAALLTGDRFHISQETTDLLRRASLSHSLALSGMHVGFAAGIGVGLAWLAGWLAPSILLRVPRPKLAVLCAAPFVAGYVWLGGASPSLVRAGIMFAAWGVLLFAGRERVLLDGLFLALALILGVSPLSAYDLGLQMSACAVAGIAVFGSPLWCVVEKACERVARGAAGLRPVRHGDGYGRRSLIERILRGVCGILIMSVCANLALLPLMAWNFGVIPLGLHLNLLWLPLLGLVVIPLGLCGLVLFLLPGLADVAQVVFGAAAWLLDCGLGVLSRLDAVGAMPELAVLRPLWPQTLGYALACVAVVFAVNRLSRRAMAAALAGLVLLVAPSLVQGVADSHERVALVLYDTGQSQALCVECPGGRRVLVDAGGGMPGFDIGRAVVGPALSLGRAPRVDLAVLSHPDTDHYRGFTHLLKLFDIGTFVDSGIWPHGEEVAGLRALVREAGVPERIVRAGERLDLGPDLWLDVLYPDERRKAGGNNASLVLRLVWKGRGLALLPGDVEIPAIGGLLAGGADVRCDVLVLPHHGSRSSFSPELYDRVAPKLAMASAGFMNYRRYPNAEVREALAQRKVPLMTVADCGRIRVVWDGADSPPRVERAVYAAGR
ncbi:competence protein ComEC [Desulfobaculum xiamenense]|uniref:Competence protein ComEC n=1 Tax=Desulfobaculum xiamenense TaxID=995050 RepID=A0A846QMP7_9BACT|nr:DNA internalization-related competence protein ComEC/Rec2 [Desulfobaculum xiamenense]NJB67742.1 competence protein ComEC [Desulfobaculum xiamenense]